ncbi:MAG TPA: homoserine O-acetyltransferase [Candidatus Limnocylindrales bacterium]|nr:homoserine O-acetyltransferase [Candidatus Limnocylindrales bacterium]
MTPDRTRYPGGAGSPGTEPTLVPPARPSLGAGRIEAADLGELSLEAGGPRLSVTLAYRHDGPGPDAPQVLVVHALTGSADAAGDWWTPLIGPGRALDTNRVGVLCANLLGGRYGSTGPTSLDPSTGAPYGPAFPAITARDQARALWALADRLGIERFSLVTGGSLGGMIAQEFALERPDAVDHVLPMAAPAATGAMAIAWNHIQLELIARLGDEGLALARQLAMTTYRSEDDFDGRFGRRREADGRFSIASYLDHQGDKLLGRFDPDTYRVLVGVMDGHDVGRGRGGIVEAYRALASSGTGVTGVGIPGDILYGADQVRALVDQAAAAGVDASYREIRSSKGHDAFLIEWDQLAAIIDEALADGIARAVRRGALSDAVAGAA